MALFKLDDVFTYQDANEIKTLWATDEPLTTTDPAADGEVRLDLNSNPLRLMRRNSTHDDGWEEIGSISAAQLLEKLLTVHGSGSGLDADKLDGQEGTYYRNASNINSGLLNKDRLPAEVVRSDQNTDVSANTEWQDGMEARFGNAADLRIQHTGTISTLNNYTGDLYITNAAPGNNILISAHQNDGTWKTMLKLDPDSGPNGSVIVPIDNLYFRVGAGGDLWLFHNGTNSYIDNNTGNLYLRELSNGGNITMQARDTSGTVHDLLTIDPDEKAVTINSFFSFRNPLGGGNVAYISNGTITATYSFQLVDTEGGTASDELHTINGGKGGDIVILQVFSVHRDVTLKKGTGNLHLTSDFTLTAQQDKIVLVAVDYTPFSGTMQWHELSRSNNA
jgi:hypothetical protein